MSLLRDFVDQMSQDAAGVAVWSFRLHQTLRAFREVMQWVEVYSVSKDEDEKDFAEVMLMCVIPVYFGVTATTPFGAPAAACGCTQNPMEAEPYPSATF